MGLAEDFDKLRGEVDNLRERQARTDELRAIVEDRLRETAELRARVKALEAISDAAGGRGAQARSGLGRAGAAGIGDDLAGTDAITGSTLRNLRRARSIGSQVSKALSGEQSVADSVLEIGGKIRGPIGDAFDIAQLVKRVVDDQVARIVKARFAELDAQLDLRLGRIQAEFERQNTPQFLSAEARERDRVAELQRINGLAHQSEYPGFGD